MPSSSFSLVIFLALPLAILACAPHSPKREEVETYEEKSDCVIPFVAAPLCDGCQKPDVSPARVKCEPNYKVSFKDSKGTEIDTKGETIYCTTKMRWGVYIAETVPTILDAKEINDVQCKLKK